LGQVLGPTMPACMLAVHLQQSIVVKDIEANSSRVLAPDEMLRRLNHGLGVLGLPEPPMVRLTCAVLNAQTGELSYSCAGHTPPLYLPASGKPELWHDIGPLLGPTDTRFLISRAQLNPGDRLLLFTDRLPGSAPGEHAALLAAAEPHRMLPLASLLEWLTQDLLTKTAEPDDFTMLGVEMVA